MRAFVLAMIILAFPIATAVFAAALATSETGEHSLGHDPVRVSLNLPDAASLDAAERLRVVIEGLRLVRPGAVYQVYLNLPEGHEPDPRGFHYLGHVSLFGKVRDEDRGSRRSFDVTEQIRALRDRGEWTGEVELTFVRGNPEPALEKVGSEEFLRFSRISIVGR
ncbi:MAG: hypothetical protein MI919_00080 [Holophagales bacterium]|nr:hypothetical protein [Holophagales bacterium]